MCTEINSALRMIYRHRRRGLLANYQVKKWHTIFALKRWHKWPGIAVGNAFCGLDGSGLISSIAFTRKQGTLFILFFRGQFFYILKMPHLQVEERREQASPNIKRRWENLADAAFCVNASHGNFLCHSQLIGFARCSTNQCLVLLHTCVL